jgi:hypothetical protein
MQAPLLIYFKENEVEFWSIDQNKRLIPINCGSDNKAPLYFLVNGDQIAMDQNAKMQFEFDSDNSYGNYWANLLNPQLKYNRFNTSHQFSTLLAYSIKETILPAIIRFNYSNLTQESFLNTYQTVIVYDSFIDEQHRNIINKELIEIIGFNPSSLVSFDYWELYRSYYEKSGKLNPKESFISINSALGDLNINLVAQNPTLTINKKTLTGRGNDPRVDTILDYVAELAIKRGSLISNDEIKKRLINEGPVILGLLKEGWVSYKIKNRNIGIYPLNLDFHRSAIDNRLNNRASLNYIQGELDNFRNKNHANGFKLFLNGEIINQDVFINFFNTTYSNVEKESIDYRQKFLTFIFHYFKFQLKLSTQNIESTNNITNITIPVLPTPPKVKTPQQQKQVVVPTPPIVKTPQQQKQVVIPTPPIVKTPQQQKQIVIPTPPIVKTPQQQKQVVVSTTPIVRTPQQQKQVVEPTPPIVKTPQQQKQVVVSTTPIVRTPQQQKQVVEPTPPIVKTPQQQKQVVLPKYASIKDTTNKIPPPPPPPPFKKK